MNPVMPERLLGFLLAALLAAGPVQAISPARSDADTPRLPFRAGEVIVKYRSSADRAAVSAMKSAHGLKAASTMFDGRFERVMLPAVLDVPGAMAMLAADPQVEYAEPNFLRRRSAAIPNDPLFGGQWGLRNTGQANFILGGPAGIAGGDINAVNAWDADGNGLADRAGRGNVIIAIIDDAFETTHIDLAANMVAGYDFVDDDNDPRPTNDSESHGTAVAGAAAAVGNNGEGIAGAAWNERIMPLRFGYDVASQLRAFDFARRNGARIVNASYGGPGYSQSEVDAIAMLAAADILFVASAGNQDSNLDFSGATYPANYRVSNVLAVAATNRQDGIASFSTHGPVTVPLAAPGLQIVTTTLDNQYTRNGINGTSFAAPYVAGIAALIRDYLPTATASEVKARLINAGERGLDPGNPAALRTAAGRLDAAAALDLLPGPSLVIRPVQTSRYALRFDSGTVDVPVFDPVVVEDGGNARLDPGESATLRIDLENLWQGASNVRASLIATDGVTAGPSVNVGTIAAGAVRSIRFPVSVPTGLSGYRRVAFTLSITADGGYSASRSFLLDIGRLIAGQTVTQTFGSGLHDEFQTWVFDVQSLPPGRNRLLIESTGSNDIDIVVRRDQPTQYNIDLDSEIELSEGDGAAFYFVNVPPEQLGADFRDGNESVLIDNAQPGSYHVTVINYDRTPGARYTLRASVANTANDAASGGGASSPAMLLLLLIGLLARAAKGAALARFFTRPRGLPGSAKA